VIELAKDLKNAGIRVLLDQWDNAEPGHSIARFIQRIYACDFVLAVGTPLYKRKADNEVSEEGSIAAAEVDMINNKLMGTEQEKRTVLPLLRTGIVKDSLPQFLWGRTYADFRADERYFVALLDVILTLHQLSFTDPTIASVRDDLRGDLVRSGALPVA